MKTGATALLGNYIADVSRCAIPDNVRKKAAYCMLDAIGLALLAKKDISVTRMRSLLTETNTTSAAHVWGTSMLASVNDAVMANALSAHAQFHDDSDYSSWTHPGSLVVPVAVTLGDSVNASLNDVLIAIAIGYNTIEWLGARDQVARGLINRGIRTSPTLGTVAAAAAAASILKLSNEQSVNAIGISSSITGGVLEPVRCGSDEWRVQNALAAHGGLLAAQLAKTGMHGAPEGLEGPKGLLHSLAGIKEIPKVWQTTPDINAILDIVAKPWATLGDNMSAVIAAKLIHDDGIQVEDIDAIRIRIWTHFTEYPGTDYKGPYTQVAQAIASMYFATAAMLAYGELEYDKSEHHRNDPKILSLISKITIEADDAGTPFDATVQVSFKDGSSIIKEAAQASKTQLLHDEDTCITLFESRLLRSGYAANKGKLLAEEIINNPTALNKLSIREFFKCLIPLETTTLENVQ